MTDNAFIKRHPGWSLGIGIALVIVGIIAFLTPVVAAGAFTIALGVLLIAGAGAMLAHAWSTRGQSGTLLTTVLGGIGALAGIIMVLNPFTGILALAVFAAVYFLFSGFLKLLIAFNNRPHYNWGYMAFSGVLAIILGFIVFLSLPSGAAWVIGVLVGIDFIFGGLSMVMLANAFKQRGGEV